MDMRNLHCRQTVLSEIANTERAVNGKVYPAGTVYIQVSAARRMGLEQFKITDADGTIESKYAVILPKVPAVPEYLLTTLNWYADRFMCKYVGTNINISVHDLKHFALGWHDSLNEQSAVMAMLEPVDLLIKQVERSIEANKDFKTQMLNDMMVQGR